MSRLSPAQKQAWTESLMGSEAGCIAFGLDAGIALGSDRITGMAALIDWRLHGQVSQRVKEGLAADSFSLFPLPGSGQTFLLYHFGANASPAPFLERLKKLNLGAVTLAESTFPKDFLLKLKQALEKQGVRPAKLEPDL